MIPEPAQPVVFPSAAPVAAPDPSLVAAITAAVIATLSALGVTRPGFQMPGASHFQDPDPSMTLVDVVNAFLVSKAKSEVSDRTQRQYTVVAKSFARGRATRPFASITREDVETWLDNDDWTPETKRHYLGDLKTLLNYAVKRGWLDAARFVQMTFVELPKGDGRKKPVEIHTPEQVRTVLEKAYRVAPDAGRILALRYFAGVRAAEVHRMSEENLLENYVEVPAIIAKTRRRRLVRIQPVLRAWLALGGELRPMGDMTLRRVIRASKVQWAKNAPRHSFVTYHLAMWENAGKTALQAGHNEEMLFAHYRELATKEVAKKFWGLFPSPELVTELKENPAS